jgi:hypothetical protein
MGERRQGLLEENVNRMRQNPPPAPVSNLYCFVNLLSRLWSRASPITYLFLFAMYVVDNDSGALRWHLEPFLMLQRPFRVFIPAASAPALTYPKIRNPSHVLRMLFADR